MLKTGDRVTVKVYGQTHTGTVDSTFSGGSLVWVRRDDGRMCWLHSESVTPVSLSTVEG